MATIAEVEKLALDLPETERAALAAHLLGSLPSEELNQRIKTVEPDAACPSSEGLVVRHHH